MRGYGTALVAAYPSTFERRRDTSWSPEIEQTEISRKSLSSYQLFKAALEFLDAQSRLKGTMRHHAISADSFSLMNVLARVPIGPPRAVTLRCLEDFTSAIPNDSFRGFACLALVDDPKLKYNTSVDIAIAKPSLSSSAFDSRHRVSLERISALMNTILHIVSSLSVAIFVVEGIESSVYYVLGLFRAASS
ncbi:hypothetical protein D9613_010399 [Agrocybe pediades]|uniref:Uncharacterized protein n=1 Tax=Agrocybe pediades TaxID=84607 RepID=A0A8H4QF83_9AGAR|nr:hypothetical protein D9613_010399 [Agrocybe pediades]